MPKLPSLAIIVVTHRSGTITAPCLKSIQRFYDVGDHLQVTDADNAPMDDSTCGPVRGEFLWV